MTKFLECRACRELLTAPAVLTTSDRMFGRTTPIDVAICSECHSYNLISLVDGKDSYPADYYTHRADGSAAKRNSLPYIVAGVWKRISNPYEDRWHRILRERARAGATMLDVGCGVGNLLQRAKEWGFAVTGIEPGPGAIVARSRGFQVIRSNFEDSNLAAESFDVVVLNHVIEHLQDPASALSIVGRLLRPGGLLMIRTPVADSLAARMFGSYWVQLDVPRHLVVFSSVALRLLVASAGFRLMQSWRDSTGFQFSGSLLYVSGSALGGLSSRVRRFGELAISPVAGLLNALSLGDQVVLVAAKPER